jgi:glucosylglycerate synthase
VDAIDLPEDVLVQLARIGAADVAVGLVTAGPGPALADVAAAIKAGLDARLSGHSAVLIQVDRAASDEAAAQLALGLGGLPVVRVPHGSALDGDDDALEWSAAVHTVLRAGQAAQARAILMLSAEAPGTPPEWPAGLVEPVLKDGCGLVLGMYQRNRYDGTLTQSLVIPFIWGLFGQQFRQPIADEFACSAEAASFFLAQDVWTTDLGRQGLPFWLPLAAIEHGVPVGQASLGRRGATAAPHPAPLGPTVGRVAGALFSLAERFEGLWLDRRGSEPVRIFGALPEPSAGGGVADPERMQVGFRQGVRDLLPVWERILAPETLGDVLALSEGESDAAVLTDRLWARIVFDFLLAYRARVMYRTHLVQSLAPLYLGRVAALVRQTRAQPAAAVVEAMERLGRVFEEEKPYLTDRWR